MRQKKRWKYERGEGRFKHCWKFPYAGFRPSKKGPVGKCSSTITEEIAEALLNAGFPFYEYDDEEYPSIIYNVHEGVIYESVATNPGTSYHGYPWQGQIPASILEQLEKRARTSGYETEFKRWLKLHKK